MLNLLFALAITASPEVKPAVNVICPVLGKKVSEKSKTVAVHGQEYRVCCDDCENKLAKDPDKYLDKEGVPKNASKWEAKVPAFPRGHEGH